MILSKRFLDAVEYAFYLHAGHMRKGTKTPYFSHLMGVASLVMEHGGTEDEAIAALLHDAVEDQGGQDTLDAIRALKSAPSLRDAQTLSPHLSLPGRNAE